MEADPNYVKSEAQNRIEAGVDPALVRQETAWALMKTREQLALVLGLLGKTPYYGLDDGETARMQANEAALAWATATRDKAAEIIARLMSGETIDRADIDWPPMPPGTT